MRGRTVDGGDPFDFSHTVQVMWQAGDDKKFVRSVHKHDLSLMSMFAPQKWLCKEGGPAWSLGIRLDVLVQRAVHRRTVQRWLLQPETD